MLMYWWPLPLSVSSQIVNEQDWTHSSSLDWSAHTFSTYTLADSIKTVRHLKPFNWKREPFVALVKQHLPCSYSGLWWKAKDLGSCEQVGCFLPVGTESKHSSLVSRESDRALIYSSCPEALGYHQLDFWQFIEWLHDLVTQWTDS